MPSRYVRKTDRRPLGQDDRRELQTLAAAGLSCAQAARRLGVTRNAVIGRAWRWGVQFEGVQTGGRRLADAEAHA